MDNRNQDYRNSKITIDDVAQALGISKTTVSRAISGKGRIGDTTRMKVMEYIQEHNYKPNVIAKGLAQSRTFNIAVALPGDYNLSDLPFFQRCLLGISNMASSMDYDVLISMIMENDMSQLTRVVENHKVDGVILTRTLLEDNNIKYLKQKGVPFVTIGSTIDEDIIQIDNDHRSACKELTSILLMKGFKRIALIGGLTTHVVTQNRYRGFEDAFTELGLVPDKDIVFMNANNVVITENIVDDLLAKKADCIVCMDDLICTYVCNKLRKEHIRLPDDIKVASFYNSALLDNLNVPITSINFDVKELGMIACKSLLNHLDDIDVKNIILLGYEVVLKESTK